MSVPITKECLLVLKLLSLHFSFFLVTSLNLKGLSKDSSVTRFSVPTSLSFSKRVKDLGQTFGENTWISSHSSSLINRYRTTSTSFSSLLSGGFEPLVVPKRRSPTPDIGGTWVWTLPTRISYTRDLIRVWVRTYLPLFRPVCPTLLVSVVCVWRVFWGSVNVLVPSSPPRDLLLSLI